MANGLKKSNKPTRYYICHLVKNRNCMFVRFYQEDFDGNLNVRKIQNQLLKPFYNDGWKLLDMDKLMTTRTEYN